MRRTFIPPPSVLSNDDDLDAEIERDDAFFRRMREPLEEVEIEYDDIFSSGKATLRTSNPEVLATPAARFMFFNQDILNTCEEMIAEVEEIGFPAIHAGVFFGTAPRGDEFFSEVVRKLGLVMPAVQEGTPLWLCLQVYFNWVRAGQAVMSGAPLPIYAEYAVLIGAAAREYELSNKHRKDVSDRQKAKGALAAANAGRAHVNAERSASAQARRQHIDRILGQLNRSSSDSATADHILARWDDPSVEDIPAKPSKKTIQNYLSSKKPSRGRTSSGKSVG